MSRVLSSSACSSLARQENQKLKLVTSLKIMFEFEFVGKPKSLSLVWLD